MSPEAIIAIIGASIVVATAGVFLFHRLPKRVRGAHYIEKWRGIQKMCSNKEDWAHAIIHADMLLDEILVKKKVVGKSMGERMVSAQDKFSSHDAVWDAHKLSNALRQNADMRLTEAKVKESLVTFRQALRDLGAL